MLKALRVLELALILATAIILLFFQQISNFIEFDIIQVVGVLGALVAASTLSNLYYSWELRRSRNEQGSFAVSNLNEAVSTAMKSGKVFKKIRIYAISTGKLQPIFEGAGLRAKSIEILLWNPRADQWSRFESLVGFADHIEHMIAQWRAMTERHLFELVSVERYASLPSDYFVVFDERCVIFGNYVPNPVIWSFVEVGEPLFATSDTESGRALIRSFIDRFDQSFVIARQDKGQTF
ncbi:hypothetical protein L2D01_10855 [Hyphomonadaceae bacterium ML37]|nr:hypothetical protein L2D01_10855 [Hyphomonadaceae bacterium ML37]